jgi:hypothetical protein
MLNQSSGLDMQFFAASFTSGPAKDSMRSTQSSYIEYDPSNYHHMNAGDMLDTPYHSQPFTLQQPALSTYDPAHANLLSDGTAALFTTHANQFGMTGQHNMAMPCPPAEQFFDSPALFQIDPRLVDQSLANESMPDLLPFGDLSQSPNLYPQGTEPITPGDEQMCFGWERDQTFLQNSQGPSLDTVEATHNSFVNPFQTTFIAPAQTQALNVLPSQNAEEPNGLPSPASTMLERQRSWSGSELSDAAPSEPAEPDNDVRDPTYSPGKPGSRKLKKRRQSSISKISVDKRPKKTGINNRKRADDIPSPPRSAKPR